MQKSVDELMDEIIDREEHEDSDISDADPVVLAASIAVSCLDI